MFAWEQCKLGDVCEEVSGNNGNVKGLPILTISAANGWMNQKDRFSQVIAGNELKKYTLLKKGHLAYNHGNSKQAKYGTVFVQNLYDQALVPRVYHSFKMKTENNPYYVEYYFATKKLDRELARLVTSGARMDGLLNINKKDFFKIKFEVPTPVEQSLIGTILQKLDQTITLHEEKKRQLERLKSALMQKMFADESGYPAIRFKRYNSAWVLRRIIDLLNQAITDGPHETPCLVGKGIPFISADAIVNNKIDFSRKRGNITKEYDLECCKKYRPQMHDIYLVKSGSTVGKVAIVETTTRFNIWSPLAALRCGEKSDPYFVFFLMQTEKFQTQVKNKASNGTQPNLSMRALERFKVIVSIELSEQQAIGNLLKKVNELIDLHKHKIDNLIAIKQWLLQNMFI
ncbi:restriction endonuclease subunit S [Lactobacillus delbrueckii subsp. bulgaricus]|nr:hypothetical protein [Lactobacillus delbrueckii subsp. bulgaricus]